jgi:hypothetical protein
MGDVDRFAAGGRHGGGHTKGRNNMLDLSHPLAQHIFAASGMEDLLMLNAQRMTLLPSDERVLLLAECIPILDGLRRLNDEHFEASLFISRAIDEAQAALEQIAHANGGNIVENRTDGEGQCAACGAPLINHNIFPGKPYGQHIILCQRCNEPFMTAKAKLGSSEGFGTCFI